MGQNVATSNSYPDEPKLEKMIKGWYDEVQFFNANYVDRFVDNEEEPPTGHYTQMVSGRTTEVGCGILKNYVPFLQFQLKQTVLVCNYGPGGNLLDNPVYKAYRH